jgi:Male sterility protein/Phosphopantetheine attachment site
LYLSRPYDSTFHLEFCAYLEDGLLKLSQGAKCARYIFDMPWNIVEHDFELPKSARHLISFESSDSLDSNRSQDRSAIMDTVVSLLDVSLSDFSPDVPFVAYGLDSLGATRIAEAIRPYANVSQMQLLGGITWKQLEARISATEHDTPMEHATPLPSTDPMLRMVEKYCKNFGIHKPSKPSPTGEVILVTGTTGAIGASVLSELVQSPAVRLIYAVNRRAADCSDLSERQKRSLTTRGLDPSIVDSSKVILLEADLDLPDLGFTLGLMEQVCDQILCVSFRLSLTSVHTGPDINHAHNSHLCVERRCSVYYFIAHFCCSLDGQLGLST